MQVICYASPPNSSTSRTVRRCSIYLEDQEVEDEQTAEDEDAVDFTEDEDDCEFEAGGHEAEESHEAADGEEALELEEGEDDETEERDEEDNICSDSTLKWAIPDLLRWARVTLDLLFKTSSAEIQHFAVARAVADSNVEIIRLDGRRWRGNHRFWRNVCAFAAKLPSDGQGDIIFDAMSQYPQSALVFSGLHELFGRDKAIGNTKLGSLLPSGKGKEIAEFDPRRHNRGPTSACFARSALTRLQETAIHMKAAAEYVFRCAYQACHESGHRCAKHRFVTLLRSNVVLDGDDEKDVKLLLSNSHRSLDLMLGYQAAWCFKQAMKDAHDAVVRRSALAGRKCGKKRQGQHDRRRVGHEQLRGILPQTMELFVENALESLATIFSEFENQQVGEMPEEVDTDDIDLALKRVLRKHDRVYKQLGAIHFASDVDDAGET